MDLVTVALIGAGIRGTVYTSYAIEHPEAMRVVAVADPDAERIQHARLKHSISEDACFSKWEDLLAGPKLADAVLICTQDSQHTEPALRALAAGYHVMLEKPMAVDPGECIRMVKHANQYNKLLVICHVLRYSPFFSTLKELLDKGTIGQLISIQHNENVGYIHQSHSYVRGNWRRSSEASPMILSKSSHDMDILLWLADADCLKVSSFGSLIHFREENAPTNAPLRCLDGCPVADRCLYYAPNIYLTDNIDWPTSVISNHTSYEARKLALETGPYGRCVYHCDNDVVDHQVVNLEFANGVTASFTMCAFTNETSRTIKIMGTQGEIRGSMEKNELEIIRFGAEKETMKLPAEIGAAGHGGGDRLLIQDFCRIVKQDGRSGSKTSAELSLQSHLMAFAAEQSRLEGKVIELQDYKKQIELSLQ